MASQWQALATPPTFGAIQMILLTDGSIMVQEVQTPFWHRYTPKGNDYVNGAWSSLTPSTSNNISGLGSDYGPNGYACAVLQDGTVIVCGGESCYDQYGNSLGMQNTCVQFDPTTNNGQGSWTLLATPPFASAALIGGAPSCVLQNGWFLVGTQSLVGGGDAGATALYDPVNKVWSPTIPNPGLTAELTWILLPDGTVLSPCIGSGGGSRDTYRFFLDPSGLLNGTWVADGLQPAGNVLASAGDTETGPAILLPPTPGATATAPPVPGRVIAFGGDGHNDLYTPATSGLGAWNQAVNFPKVTFPAPLGKQQLECADAPACLLPNGNVLVAAGPPDSTGHSGDPVQLYLYVQTAGKPGKLVRVAGPPDPSDPTNPKKSLYDGFETENLIFLLLPTGKVMVSDTQQSIRIFTPPNATPDPLAIPAITSSPAQAKQADTIALSGTLFGGVSQGSSFGDDWSNSTNYPLVLATNPATGEVAFWRTRDFTIGVATGTNPTSTNVIVPPGATLGTWNICAVVNGISSPTVPIAIQPAGVLMAAVDGSIPIPLNQTQETSFEVKAWDSVTLLPVQGFVTIEDAQGGAGYFTEQPGMPFLMWPTVTIFTKPVEPGVSLVMKSTVYPKCTATAPGYTNTATVDLGYQDSTVPDLQPTRPFGQPV